MVTVGRCVPAVLGFNAQMLNFGVSHLPYEVAFRNPASLYFSPLRRLLASEELLNSLLCTPSLASWASSSPLLPGAPDCPQSFATVLFSSSAEDELFRNFKSVLYSLKKNNRLSLCRDPE